VDPLRIRSGTPSEPVNVSTLRLAEIKAEIPKWMFGVVGLQTLAILGGVAALLRLIR
jgi:hypothetical protein